MQSLMAFAVAFTVLFFSGAQSATLTFTNNCPVTIWPGNLNNAGSPHLSTTGFILGVGASLSVNVPASWSGRFWARTRCSTDSTGKFACATGDCGSGSMECNGAGATPPTSLAEFTLAANDGHDYYDISLVDGFNLPLSITPQGGCRSTSCSANVNAVCDPNLAVKGSDGSVIGCKSACFAFNEPRYCCTGQFSTPDKCPPTAYSMIFKNQCPQAYSYAYDDKTSIFTCPTGANYVITFCP